MSRHVEWKEETIRQWNNDPCGEVCDHTPGTAMYYTEVERQRYEEYAPWMRPTFHYDMYQGKKVLEVGFGQGTDLIQFARGGAKVYGIDLTPRHVELTQRRFALEGRNVGLVRGDAEILPFADNSFDVVYSFGVLHHTPDTEKAIQEIWRVLKPKGEAIIALYHRNSAVFAYVLLKGVLTGRLFTEGYRALLSRIEQRRRSDAMPLVKVYSQSSARRLFHRYSSLDLIVRHFDWNRLYRIRRGRWLFKVLRRYESFWERFGWYVIIRAYK